VQCTKPTERESAFIAESTDSSIFMNGCFTASKLKIKKRQLQMLHMFSANQKSCKMPAVVVGNHLGNLFILHEKRAGAHEKRACAVCSVLRMTIRELDSLIQPLIIEMNA
jgi:hypothetical protein